MLAAEANFEGILPNPNTVLETLQQAASCSHIIRNDNLTIFIGASLNDVPYHSLLYLCLDQIIFYHLSSQHSTVNESIKNLKKILSSFMKSTHFCICAYLQNQIQFLSHTYKFSFDLSENMTFGFGIDHNTKYDKFNFGF